MSTFLSDINTVLNTQLDTAAAALSTAKLSLSANPGVPQLIDYNAAFYEFKTTAEIQMGLNKQYADLVSTVGNKM